MDLRCLEVGFSSCSGSLEMRTGSSFAADAMKMFRHSIMLLNGEWVMVVVLFQFLSEAKKQRRCSTFLLLQTPPTVGL